MASDTPHDHDHHLDHDHDHEQQHGHGHGHVHMGEAEWAALAAHAELEAEVLLQFVTDAIAWAGELRHPAAPPVRTIIDIGSGPGVGTCELARLFPDARVIAVDGSTAMLTAVRRRAADLGLSDRIDTRLAELPDGAEALGRADLIWASMSLHHIGDEIGVMRTLRDHLTPHGQLVVTEFGDPMRLLPDDLDVGRPGLSARLDDTAATWFASMRAGLPGTVQSEDFPDMLAAAGYDVQGSRLARVHLPAPLSPQGRQFALTQLERARQQFADRLAPDDVEALTVLTDPQHSSGLLHRDGVFVDASRRVMVASPAEAA